MPPPRIPSTSFPDRARRNTSTIPTFPPPSSPSRPLIHPICSTAAPPPHSPSSKPDEDCTPHHWTDCFDTSTDISLPSRNAVFRIYSAGLTPQSPLAIILLHGGGHSALSWALVTNHLKSRCAVIAFDARGHGNTTSQDDSDLSADTQITDAAALLEAFFAQQRPGVELPKLVICGHSMGGAIAVRIAAARLLQNVVGLVVIDVVEGTAMSALPYMSLWLQARTASFASVERAIRYVIKAGHVRNAASARLSVPAQLIFSEKIKRWVWRTNLEESEQHWRGWFEGLSALFLSVPAAKMLVLASVDRLDRDLMIAQMQGKFQNILIPAAGHIVHEDQPLQTAQVLLSYLERNLFLTRQEDDDEAPVSQQRSPIPPCC